MLAIVFACLFLIFVHHKRKREYTNPSRFHKKSDVPIPPTGVQVSRIDCPTPFDYGYLHPDEDNYQVRDPNITALEPGLTRLWYEDVVSLSQCCKGGGIVLDIGSHFGYYALLAASVGCKVIAAEPVPLFRSILNMNLNLNSRMPGKVEMVPYAIGLSSKEVRMFVPTTGILGTARVTSDYIESSDIIVQQKRIDTLLNEMGVKENICMLKADVEGQEPDVILSAKYILEKHKIYNIMLEFSPGYKKDGLNEMLSLLHSIGYCATVINWKWAKWPGRVNAVPIDKFIGAEYYSSLESENSRVSLINGVGFNTNLFLTLNCSR